MSNQRGEIEQAAFPGTLTHTHVAPGAIDHRTEPRIVARAESRGIDGGDPVWAEAGAGANDLQGLPSMRGIVRPESGGCAIPLAERPGETAAFLA